MRPYVVYGAGAVGSALAAYLSRQGHPVLVVAREPHVEAVRRQEGIRVMTRSETFLAPARAETHLPDALPEDAVLMLTVQATDLPSALGALAPAAATRSVVTWQNGIRAEETAAPHCPSLFGGVVRFTCTRLVPGEVRLRSPGLLILGRHPRGPHPEAARILEDLARAGFRTAESPDIQADKALKLLVNLVSGPPVLIRRTGKDPVLARLQVALLEEGRRVLDAAGIRAAPASGAGQPVDDLIARFRTGGTAPDTSGGIYNSTWQNLHHRRPRLENDFYHGEIVRLGERFGVEAPVNARVLEVLEEVREKGLGPESFDPPAFRARFEDVLDEDDFGAGIPGDASPEDPLEI